MRILVASEDPIHFGDPERNHSSIPFRTPHLFGAGLPFMKKGVITLVRLHPQAKEIRGTI